MTFSGSIVLPVSTESIFYLTEKGENTLNEKIPRISRTCFFCDNFYVCFALIWAIKNVPKIQFQMIDVQMNEIIPKLIRRTHLDKVWG